MLTCFPFFFQQIFLTLCTLVTIYFADEVPLTVNQHVRLSDSAPLLDEQTAKVVELSKSKSGMHIGNGNSSGSDHGQGLSRKPGSPKEGDSQNGGFNDGPGAVLVNLLTSLRHLPPAMHAVLIVMALSWVGLQFKFSPLVYFH